MSALDRAFDIAKSRKPRVVFPERFDERVVRAVEIVRNEGIAEPVWLDQARPAEQYVEVIQKTKPKYDEAKCLSLLQEQSTIGGAMVAAGEADTMVSGAATETAKVIRGSLATVGTAPGVRTVSSFFLMVFPGHREFIFADCAVNLAPDAQGLASIAIASCRSAEKLLGDARGAMLSYSTGASGAGDSVELVQAATDLALQAGAPVIGPAQSDAALNSVIAERKGLTGGGNANVLIFPTLDAGNIAYKLCQELAGAQAVGPFLQGFAKPVCDLSRGATVEDIVAATAVTAAMMD